MVRVSKDKDDFVVLVVDAHTSRIISSAFRMHELTSMGIIGMYLLILYLFYLSAFALISIQFIN